MAKIPKAWHQYFWEVVPEKVDMKKHPFYVLEYGDAEAVKKAREFYGARLIKKTLLSKSAFIILWAGYKIWRNGI